MSERPPPVDIGTCVGCDRVRVLNEGACADCLRAPRGRTWANMSHRVRTDPLFALEVYQAIKTAAGRRLFVSTYGLPPGAHSRAQRGKA